MKSLTDNIYNRTVRPEQPKFKLWCYAGLILTYKCPAACEFCYYNCSPAQDGLMPIDTALGAWQSLCELAGHKAKLHLTGGEPMLYFEHLIRLLTEAQNRNLTGFDQLETNAFWATDRRIITDRIKLLDRLGMDKLKISYDPFHAEYIDIEPVRLLARTAAEVLGPERVLVRWQKYLDHPMQMKDVPPEIRRKRYQLALQQYPCRFTGRAAKNLANLRATKTVDQLVQVDCSRTFLGAKGVHIDPAGNVFIGTCSGIVVGNVNHKPLESIWQEFTPDCNRVIKTLFYKGPAGLTAMALPHGYRPRDAYADPCHLCFDARQFFFDKGLFRSIICPIECYT